MRIARTLVDGVATWIGAEGPDAPWRPIADPYAAFAAGADPAPLGEALAGVAADGPELLAPCAPLAIVGIAQNRTQNDHPLPVQGWLKSPRTVVASGVPVDARRDAGRLVVEAELALVVGSDLFQASVDEAMAGILGYTAVNDVSYPDRSLVDQRNFEAKGGIGATPLGPWIETGPIGDVPIRMTVGGVDVVDTTSGALPVSLAECVAYVSHWLPLGPGDVIMTGAPFSNAPAQPGDRVDIRVGDVSLTTQLH
ncbi:fumarylacetoacetate hydrolase family protein [Agrococcus jejuensis]|uniref:2-keto-4-pentenoate hydratase/2-oxohepta-3-ene-1,7-dioic acid hydratase (Catechol pathway) n=1 Tax=Agrococcus jejuensis TaxID=399736 RepID=A0A1G8FN12_9MICO|nr:fumarylacetoacetate hydrolase family protein [Agrococcus jejuensis]SDH83479.1 2-keto-4-pentenoate hydratase/2-oxohepta-3-ene-1,7-dioic acid hydratase (catechol pathway) [Agrococcus jejuensis]